MLIQAAGSQALALTKRLLPLPDSLASRRVAPTTSAAAFWCHLVVFEDTATVSCAGVGSRGPPEDREAGCRVYAGLSRASQQGGC